MTIPTFPLPFPIGEPESDHPDFGTDSSLHEASLLGDCWIRFWGIGMPMRIRISYSAVAQELEVWLKVGKASERRCLVARDVFLASHRYFGFTGQHTPKSQRLSAWLCSVTFAFIDLCFYCQATTVKLDWTRCRYHAGSMSTSRRLSWRLERRP